MNQESRTTTHSSELLADAIHSGDQAQVAERLEELPADETVRLVSRLEEADQVELLNLLAEPSAAGLVEELPEAHAVQVIDQLEPSTAAAILNEVASDTQADLLTRLDPEQAEAVLQAMKPEEASDARRLMQFDAETAGGLMVTEFLSYSLGSTVDDVLNDLRGRADRYRRFDVQYAYVVDEAGKLDGVLRMRDLLLAPADTTLVSLRIPDPLSVRTSSGLAVLQQFFAHHQLFGVPVIDAEDRLCGVIRRQDVEHAAQERASRSLLKFTGILGGEELRSMPFGLRSFRRLSWLSINIVLNIVAASVIAMYQDTLSAAITLAVFLPIISDMSGCSGSQSVAVSMRELSLNLVRPREVLHVLKKELIVGIINGLMLGLLLGTVAYVWKGNIWLGGVVAIALAVNTLVAVCLGGVVPLLLRLIGQDPALASGPILTTVTDMCGFFLVLSLASAVLPHLTT